MLAAALLLLSALSCPAQGAAPFLHHRARQLEYFGTDRPASGTNAAKVIWFGPTNELYWAASYAFSNLAPDVLLVPCWADDPWKAGVSLLTRAIYQVSPLAVLGSVDSASTHLAEQIVAKANLPLISPIATDPSLTLAGVPWMLSCAPSDVAIAAAIRKHLREEDHPIALFSGTDHESRMTSREILNDFSRQGRLPAFRFQFEPGASRVSLQLQVLADAKPRTVLLVSSTEDASRLLPELRRLLPETTIIGSPKVTRAGPAAEGVLSPLLTTPPADHHFARAFLLKYSQTAAYDAWLTYDAAALLATALRKAPNKLLPTLTHQLSPYPGAAGEIRFDGTGQNTRSNLEIGIVRGGVLTPLKDMQVSHNSSRL